MYELGLGNFRIDSFDDSDISYNNAICYFLFFFATALIMIVFLNMLIAIMSDTFDQASDERASNERYQRLRIMGEYV